MMTTNHSKQDFKRWFTFLDVLVVGVFAVSLMLLIRDTYVAGYYEDVNAALHYDALWNIVRDAVFLVASLGWIFVRYWTDKIKALQNPWA